MAAETSRSGGPTPPWAEDNTMDSEAGRHSADVPFGGDDLLREPFATTNGSVAVITGVRDPEATTAPDPGSDETTSEEGPVDTSTAPMKGTEPTVIPIVKDVLSLVGDKWVLLGKEVPPEKGVGNKWQQFRRGNTSQYPESKQNTPIDGLGVTPRQIEKGNLSLRQVEGLIDVARGERARLLGEADTKRLEIYHDSLVKRLQHLVQTRGIRPIIAAEDGKSSTKTVTLLGMGAQFAKYTHVAVVLFPSTRSQGTVTAGSLSGAKLTENTITAKEFMLTSDQFETGRDVMNAIPMIEPGIHVLIEDQSAGSLGDDLPASIKYVKAGDKVLLNEAVVLLDGANDDPGAQGYATIPRMAGRLAHVVIAPIDDKNRHTHPTVRGTITSYNDPTELDIDFLSSLDREVFQEPGADRTIKRIVKGEDGEEEEISYTLTEEEIALAGFKNARHTGLGTTLREKAEHAIIIASCADLETHPREYFRKLTIPEETAKGIRVTNPKAIKAIGENRSHAYEELEWKGESVHVPFEPAVKLTDNEGNPLPLDFTRYGIKTNIGLLEACVFSCERSADVMHIDVEGDETYSKMKTESEMFRSKTQTDDLLGFMLATGSLA